MPAYHLAPSLLSANFAHLGRDARAVLAAGADQLHLDVMDNHYVPNLTVGPMVCKALRDDGITAPIDVHLMVKPVDRLIRDFAKAGASEIVFHPEASAHIDRSLALIRDHGCRAGLVLNPATSFYCLEYVLDKIDLILLMSVNPGFGGQTLIPTVFDKIRQLRAWLPSRGVNPETIRIAIDGGINASNIAKAASAGADTFVAGTAIFGQSDYKAAIDALRAALKTVTE